jgi:hypothetical protein
MLQHLNINAKHNVNDSSHLLVWVINVASDNKYCMEIRSLEHICGALNYTY